MARGILSAFNEGWDTADKIVDDVNETRASRALTESRKAQKAIDDAPVKMSAPKMEWEDDGSGSPIQEFSVSSTPEIDPKYYTSMREAREKYLDQIGKTDPMKAMQLEDYFSERDRKDAVKSMRHAAQMMKSGDEASATKAALQAYGLINDGNGAQIRRVNGQLVGVAYDEKTGEYKGMLPLNPDFFNRMAGELEMGPEKWRALNAQTRAAESSATRSETEVERMQDPTSPENVMRDAGAKTAAAQAKAAEFTAEHLAEQWNMTVETHEANMQKIDAYSDYLDSMGMYREAQATGLDTAGVAGVFGSGKEGQMAAANWTKNLDMVIAAYAESGDQNDALAYMFQTRGGKRLVADLSYRMLQQNPRAYSGDPNAVVEDAAHIATLELAARKALPGGDAPADELLSSMKLSDRMAGEKGKPPQGMYVTMPNGREVFLSPQTSPAFFANRAAYYEDKAKNGKTPQERADARNMAERIAGMFRSVAEGTVAAGKWAGDNLTVPAFGRVLDAGAKGAVQVGADAITGALHDPDDPIFGGGLSTTEGIPVDDEE